MTSKVPGIHGASEVTLPFNILSVFLHWSSSKLNFLILLAFGTMPKRT
jgi:hypothetical protein